MRYHTGQRIWRSERRHLRGGILLREKGGRNALASIVSYLLWLSLGKGSYDEKGAHCMQEDVGRFDAAIFNVKAAFSIDDPRCD